MTPTETFTAQRRSRTARLTRLGRVMLGYALCVLLGAVGLGLELGAGWGLAAAGTVGALSFLLLADTDDGPKPR